MTLPASRFLDPAALTGIHDLRLVARTVVEGFLSGLHADPRPAAGVEFHQYRQYEPGDDLRRVDWRAYARSDRFLVKESEVERDVTVRFLLDATASMAHADGPATPSTRTTPAPINAPATTAPATTAPAISTPVITPSVITPPPMTKFDYARLLVACLAYLVDRQGDRIRFHAVRDGGTLDLPGGRGRVLLQLLHLLEAAEPTGAWPPWDRLVSGLAGARGRELVVVISDLYEEDGEIRGALGTLRALGHEVLVLQPIARNELTFSFRGDVRFEDLETGRSVTVDAAAARSAWLERLERSQGDWRRHLLEIGVSHELLPLDQPLDRALRSFLLRRRALRR